ncbi:MAG TPA: hypothetical protein VFI35_06845, partial [Actinomycetota bacterium]|nr:hypothetical protein [Actinomycetota bacterium]
MPPVTHATAKFLTAIVAFAASWAALRWWVFADMAHPWLLTLAAGPACGLAARSAPAAPGSLPPRTVARRPPRPPGSPRRGGLGCDTGDLKEPGAGRLT